jgi:DNA-binding NarL/FixJ family response regulator
MLLEVGPSNTQIARQLCIELATVKNHVHHILQKLPGGRRSQHPLAPRSATAA